MRIRSLVRVAAVMLAAASLAAPTAAAAATTTQRISVTYSGTQADRASGSPSMSADGRYVAFTSDAATMVRGDTNNTADVFVRDRRTGISERISVDSLEKEARLTDPTKQPSIDPAITPDGRYVVFSTGAWNLAPGDTNELPDIYLRDIQAGLTERITRGLAGAQPNGGSHYPAISANGRYVAFLSAASNLVAGDTNGATDTFVFDREAEVTTRASVRWDGAEVPQGSVGKPAVDATGSVIAYYTTGRLHPYDDNGIVDVYAFKPSTGVTEPISLDNAGNFPNGNTWDDATTTTPAISVSSDGRFVAFESGTPTLVTGDTNAARDIFVRDRTSSRTDRVSLTWQGREVTGPSRTPSISTDGRYVAFASDGVNVAPADANGSTDVFVVDRTTMTAVRTSLTQGGTEGNNQSHSPAIAADASAVAFTSTASNLVDGDTNSMADVFVRGPALSPPPTTPTVYSPQDGDTIRSPSVAFQGIGQPASVVRIDQGTTTLASTTVLTNGTWSTTAVLSDGSYSVRAIARADGVDSAPSEVIGFIVDTAPPPPEPPTITSPANGSATNSTTVIVAGRAQPSASIEILEGTATVATTAADGDGRWSTSMSAAVGTHTIHASDGVGSSPTVTFTVDLTPPVAPVITTPEGGSTFYSNPITFKGTAEPKTTILLTSDGASIGTTSVGTTGSWTKATGVSEGSHSIVARARDAAGNIGPPSEPILITVRIDVIPPTVTVDDTRYTVKVSANDTDLIGTATDNLSVERVEVVVREYGSRDTTAAFNAVCVGCGTPSATWTATLDLSPGVYNVYVNAVDIAGLRSLTAATTVVYA